jgi:hypothetical protein
MVKRTLVSAALALVACVCLTGCDLGNIGADAGPMVTDSRSVNQGGAKSVAVEMDMSVGDLKLTGGASDLMNADFRYNVPGWKPDVQYGVSGTQGKLVVRQPSLSGMSFNHTQNHWDVRLRDVLPMDLKVRCETGSSNLVLNGLALNSLTVNAQTGDASVNLSSRYARLRTVAIATETGRCAVEMTGDYPSLDSLRITGETGDVTANLAGSWTKNADIEIGSETGSVTVTLPKEVGVHITTHKDTGGLHVSGLNTQGNVYTNDAYGKSPITLRLNVHVNTGDITLQAGRL